MGISVLEKGRRGLEKDDDNNIKEIVADHLKIPTSSSNAYNSKCHGSTLLNALFISWDLRSFLGVLMLTKEKTIADR